MAFARHSRGGGIQNLKYNIQNNPILATHYSLRKIQLYGF